MDIGGERRRVFPPTSSSKPHVGDKTIIDKIMLRFRPIAPKPDTGGSEKPGSNKGWVGKGRAKRKYVRIKGNNESYKRRSEKILASSKNDDVKTLQFLPESSVRDIHPRASGEIRDGSATRCGAFDGCCTIMGAPLMLFSMNNNPKIHDLGELDRTAVEETRVIVESVSGTCMAGARELLGNSDMERMKNLEKDTCPGFISDSCNRVLWINPAYWEMVCIKQPEISVRIEGAEKLFPCLNPNHDRALTCWVRLKHTWQKVINNKSVQIVPCDVWRMDFGGFAWRLDLKVALGLGFENAIGRTK